MRRVAKCLVLLLFAVYRADADTPRTFLVTNANDSGSGSLRAAIDEVNAICPSAPFGGECKIDFRIPLAGAQWATIRPTTPLPAISRSVSIDGNSQTRFADTNPLGPEIEINGSLLTAGNGLTITEPCSAAVLGLALNGFPDNGLYIGGGDCGRSGGLRTAIGNYIGTDPTGTRAVPNLRGIFVAHEGTDPHTTTFIGSNVISGNRYSGVWIGSGRNARLYNNIIGLNAAVTGPLGNGSSGVYVGAGGSGADLVDNYIGFNGHYGISIDRAATNVMAATNSFQANGNLAIDHGLDGVSPSVPDLGERPGNVLHAPILHSAEYHTFSDTTIIIGSVDVRRVPQGNRSIFVTLYANDEPDPSGFGEGQYFLGRADPDRETGGFRLVYAGRPPGRWIAAIATSSQIWGLARTPGTDAVSGGHSTTTSEFSRTIEVTP